MQLNETRRLCFLPCCGNEDDCGKIKMLMVLLLSWIMIASTTLSVSPEMYETMKL